LKNKNFEEQNNIITSRPCIILMGFLPSFFENGTKYLPIHSILQFDQRITCFINTAETYIEVEETKLFHDVLLQEGGFGWNQTLILSHHTDFRIFFSKKRAFVKKRTGIN